MNDQSSSAGMPTSEAPNTQPTLPTDNTPAPDVATPKASEPKDNRKMLLLCIVAAVVVVGLAAGALLMHKKPAAKPVVATRTVKIGLLAPLTGDLANYGQVLERGAQLAHRDFNQEGLTIKL